VQTLELSHIQVTLLKALPRLECFTKKPGFCRHLKAKIYNLSVLGEGIPQEEKQMIWWLGDFPHA
jgi:hypothetical protein